MPMPRAASAPSRRRRGPSSRRQARWALAAVAAGAFCVQLDSFALNPALPVIRAELHGSAAAAAWTVSGYLLAAGSLMPVAGRLGDLYGRRRMLLVGLVLFAAAASLCALAPSLPLLVAARVLQGAGGALIMPTGLALLTNVCPPDREQRGLGGHRAIGRALGLAGVATVCGPFLGGVLAASVSWRAVFWLTVPPTAIAALCALRAPASRAPDPRPFDVIGAVTATGALACLARWLQQPADGLWGAAAALLGALFVRAERRAVRQRQGRCSPVPLLDPSLFRNRPYVTLTAAGAVANAATVALLYVLPLLLSRGRGWPAAGAEPALLAPAAALAVGGPLAGRVRPAAAVRVMMLCLFTAAAALCALGWAGARMAAADGFTASAVATTTTIGRATTTTMATPMATTVMATAAATVAAAALGVAGGLALAGTQAVVRRERAGEASGVTKAVMTATAGLGLTAGGGSGTSLALPAAACLVAGGALVLELVLVRVGRPG
ncbi:MFS transporter [Streptomyces sp. N2A]|uniref:MFS transporter n=1 Tax=Streptomyces sp. N2A TaxID=3073936 RepID=UPI00287075BC|nr:MFS transporter [Streptomyces sp. N2A]